MGAWIQEKLIGASQIILSKQPNTAVIFDTAVKPDYQNRGIGSKLLQYRRQFLKEHGITKTISTIAPWNGASLNLSLNKNGGKGTRYFRDCCGAGEDRIEVSIDFEKDPELVDEKDAEIIFIPLSPQEQFLGSSERFTLEQLLNRDKYQAIGIVKPRSGEYRHANLILKKGGD